MGFSSIFTGRDALQKWVPELDAFAVRMLGPRPSVIYGSGEYAGDLMSGDPEAAAAWDRRYMAEVEPAFIASLPPDRQAAYLAAKGDRSSTIDASNKISKIGALGTIGAAGLGAGLTAAGVLGGGASGGIGAAEAAGALGGVPPSGAGAGAAGVGGAGFAGAAGLGGAMDWMSLIGPAVDIGGALLGSNAAGKAADSQQAATNAAIAEQRRQYDLNRADFAPYRQAGVNALSQLTGEIDRPLTAEEVMAEPGFAFGLQQGQRAIDNKISAGGGRVSGQAIKAAGRWGTDYAAGQYGAAYSRRQDRLNRLASLAGIGQTSTAASTIAGQNSANTISGLISSQGDATGASQMARGSIWQNALGSAGAGISDYYKRRAQPNNGGGFAWNINGGWTGER